MKDILLITSSPRGEDSYSTQVARNLVDRIQAEFPGANVKTRDLWRAPLPILDVARVAAIRNPTTDGLSPEQLEFRQQSDAFIADLFEADTIVIASGMINFSVPTVLKAWIDMVARSGQTFRYTESGPEGLLKNKKAYLVLASGGVYSEGPMQAMDHQSSYLHAVLSFMGLNDIQTIRVEGVAYGPDAAELAVSSAKNQASELATAL